MGKYKGIALVFLLFGCKKPDITVPTVETKVQSVEEKTVVGTSVINVVDYDAIGGLKLIEALDSNNKSYGCLMVDKSNGYPVFDGQKSVRFEVRDGDCGWMTTSSAPSSDCATNRSRREVCETNVSPENGKTVTYTERVFIPEQPMFKPNGGNLLVLTQLRFEPQQSLGALAYLVMENDNTLLIRTHRGFSWDWNRNYPITNKPYNKWFTIKYQVKVSDGNDGEIKVFVDDVLLFTETRPTIPAKDGWLFLKFGIYNSFKNLATQSFGTQVMYIDGIEKKVS